MLMSWFEGKKTEFKSHCKQTQQELAEKYGEKIFMLQSIARTAVRDVDPQVLGFDPDDCFR